MIHEDVGSSPGLAQWLRIRRRLEPWCRSVAVTLIGPLAWKPPHASGEALKRQKNKEKAKELLKGTALPSRSLMSALQERRAFHAGYSGW